MNDRYEKERAEIEDFFSNSRAVELSLILDHMNFLIGSIIDGHSHDKLKKIAMHIKRRLEDIC